MAIKLALQYVNPSVEEGKHFVSPLVSVYAYWREPRLRYNSIPSLFEVMKYYPLTLMKFEAGCEFDKGYLNLELYAW